MRLILYTGKGGVGKTTTAAATAACAASRGHRSLVISADAAHSLGDVLGYSSAPSRSDRSDRSDGLDDGADTADARSRPAPGAAPGLGSTSTPASRAGAKPAARARRRARSRADDQPRRLGSEPVTVARRLDAVEVDARVEMERHWGRVREYLVALFRYQGIEEVVAEELALLPGAEELTTLLAVERFARLRRYDLIVVDCAPTDSTLRLVTLPDVAHGAMRVLLRVQRAVAAMVTPIATHMIPIPLPDADVFRDAERLFYRRLRSLRRTLASDSTSVRIVLTPERMVIDESRRAYTDLCLFDLACDALVLNRVLPAEAASEPFFHDLGRRQQELRGEIEQHFAPLPVLCAPLREDEVIGFEALAAHGEALYGDRDPIARLSDAPRIRFEAGAEGVRAILPLPGALASELDVVKIDDDLVLTAGGRRRAVKLPRRLARLGIEAARLEDGLLTVTFAESLPAPLGVAG